MKNFHNAGYGQSNDKQPRNNTPHLFRNFRHQFQDIFQLKAKINAENDRRINQDRCIARWDDMDDKPPANHENNRTSHEPEKIIALFPGVNERSDDSQNSRNRNRLK